MQALKPVPAATGPGGAAAGWGHGATRLWPLLLSTLIVGFTCILALQGLGRFETFHNRTFDLALYTRAAFGLSHGDGWNPVLDQSFVASHWSLVLAPLGLLGRFVGTAELLIVCQAVAMAVTAWPLARIGQRRGGPVLALLAAGAYLLYPNVIQVGSYEFHPGNLALPAIAFAFDAIDRRDARGLAACAVWVLACRADFALCLAMLGWLARMLDRPRLGRTGAALTWTALAYFALVLGARAWLDGPQRAPGSADLHFGPWGGNPFGILSALWTDPARVAEHVTLARLSYPVRVLLPLSLLPLLRARYLLPALPFLAINLISVFPTTTELYSHYLTPAVPALVVAAVDGVSRLSNGARTLALGFLSLAAVSASFVASGAPWARDHDARAYRFDQHAWSASWALDAVPKGASVQAPDALLPHLAERAVVHRAPPPERGTDFVVLDVGHRLRFFGQETVLRTSEEPLVRAWLARRDHAVIAGTPTYLVLQRGLGGPRARFARRFFLPEPPADPAHIRLCACLSLARATLHPERLELILQAHGACPADLALRMGSAQRPGHVRLLFDGYLSPVHVRAGEWVVSDHRVPQELVARIRRQGLRLGALRTSGAPPEHGDPVSAPIPFTFEPAP